MIARRSRSVRCDGIAINDSAFDGFRFKFGGEKITNTTTDDQQDRKHSDEWR